MKALFITAPQEWEILEIPTPDITHDEVLIRVGYVGLCGTDLELLNGKHPFFSTNDASFPMQIGHEMSGTIAQSMNSTLPVGTEVIMDPIVGCGNCEGCTNRATWCSERIEIGVRRGGPGALAEFVKVPIANVYPIPEGVSLRDATLAEPAVTAIAGISRIKATSGRALVVGDGTIGIIAAQVLAHRGWQVLIAVLSQASAERVRSLGFEPVMPEDMESISAKVVVEAAGTHRSIQTTFRAVTAGGEVVLLGVPDKPMESFDIASLVLRDISVYGVLNGPGRYNEALTLIAEGVIKSSEIIDQEFSFDQFADAIGLLANPDRKLPKVLVRMSS
ncbi:MAG: alcohol dehydrogenase catalytic domain-containing protein [Actinobacteria bacterium]|nr:alcohol dehydrogenase catalytic domain-containing protein [Actinomycetota bacterium]